MFTGIIEEIGIISSINQTGEAIMIKIDAQKIIVDVKLGDSISVNGVCLTVTSFTSNSFSVDVMPETVRATGLNKLKVGSRVNLERAMAANGRFGGHFVSGHVDGLGTIKSKKQVDNAVYYEIKVPDDLLSYIIYKGSIAVDGTSLTVFGIGEDYFTISLIPHTHEETVLGNKGIGDVVNIECDMLGKYIEQFIEKRFTKQERKTSGLTESFLSDHGFK
jgi:riboflavin synthase